MQELEKILEEIEKGTHTFELLGREVDFVAIDWVRDIIRKHMNDGWVSVDERLPNHLLDCEVTLHNGSRSIARYVESDGCWMDHNDFFSNVIAWKEPSEPYRPEKSEK